MWHRTLNRAIQALIILIITYYTLIGGFVAGIREYPWRITTEIITFLLLGGWLFKKLVKKEDLLKTPLDWPILALIAVSLVSAPFSTDPRVSWENAFLNILFVLLFYFTLELVLNLNLRKKFINAILVVSAVIALIGLFEFWQWYGGQLVRDVNWQSTGLSLRLLEPIRIKSVLHNPNYLAYFLLVGLGLSLKKIIDTQPWWKKAAWTSYMLMILANLALTQSRGGGLGVLVIFFSFFGMLWIASFRSQKLKQINRTQTMAMIGSMLALAVIFVWLISSRTNLFTASIIDILRERSDFWWASLKMAADHPLTGVGAGTYPTQYLLYRDLSAFGVGFIITHAHNLWLTIIAEYGLLGLGAVVWTMIAFGSATYHSFKQPQEKTEFMWLVASIAILLGQATHNLFDDFLEFPVYTWYTIFIGTLCLAPRQVTINSNAVKKWPWRTLLATIAGLIVLLSALYFNRGFAAYHRARLASQENDWAQTTIWLEQAVMLDPTNRFYLQQLALSYSWLAQVDHRYLPLAIETQQKVIQQNSAYPLDYAHLACLYWEVGNTEAAIATMTQAVLTEAPISNYAGLRSWHTGQVTYQFNLGYYYERTGNSAQAQVYYQQSMLHRPEVAGSIFWQQTPERVILRQSIIEDINPQDVPFATVALINYFAGNYQPLLNLSAIKLVETPNDIGARIMRARALIELGQQVEVATILHDIPTANLGQYTPVYLDLIDQLNLTEEYLQEIEKTIQIAAVLGGEAISPIISYYWGQLAEKQKNSDQAENKYQEAIFRATAIDTDYANLIGRRLPLAQERMPCLLFPYTEQELSLPSLRLATLYEAANETEAAKNVYENLLLYEPYHQLARERLKRLHDQDLSKTQ